MPVIPATQKDWEHSSNGGALPSQVKVPNPSLTRKKKRNKKGLENNHIWKL
jgi:hypothetical protein